MNRNKTIGRRRFLKRSAGLLGAHALTARESVIAQTSPQERPRIKEHRVLGRTGFEVSDLSVGTSLNSADPSVLHALLSAGVNFIDTGETYGNGQAERNVGRVIKRHDRKSLFINTKLYLTRNRTEAEVLSRVRKCLERLETDYVDSVMIHSALSVEMLKTPGFHAALDQLKREGRVRFVGVSSHGTHGLPEPEETMDKILLAAAEDGRFDILLFVYNFIAREKGQKILESCSEKNIGTAIMKTNPVGYYHEFQRQVDELTAEGKEVPEWLQFALPRYKEQAARAEGFLQEHDLTSFDEIRDAAIRFVLNHGKVDTICLTFPSFGQVDTYLRLSGSRFEASDDKMLSAFAKACGPLYCRHACGLCASRCPHGVPVNTVMRYNHYFAAQGAEKFAMTKYENLSTPKADTCSSCKGYCEAACPFGVPIQALLVLAHPRLTLDRCRLEPSPA